MGNYSANEAVNCHFSQIELSLSAADLIDPVVLCKSDLMVVLYIKGADDLLQELGRTVVVLNSLRPRWIRKFTITYQFKTVQNLVFRVYDVGINFHGIDVKALKLEEQKFIGEAGCTLSADTPLIIESFNFNINGKHDLLGKVQISLAELEKVYAAEAGENLFIPLSAGQIHQNKVIKSQLLVDKYLENIQHTFLHPNPMVAIDFTGNVKNGYWVPFSPTKPSCWPDAYRGERYIPSEGLMQKVTSILISKVHPQPQQLLPVTNTDAHLIMQNMQKLELGKLVFTLATTATLGLLFSHKRNDRIAVGFLVSCMLLYNGIAFGAINSRLGNLLQLVGINIILSLVCVLVGSFLPLSLSLACWLCAAFYLVPLLYILIKPHPGPYLQRFEG